MDPVKLKQDQVYYINKYNYFIQSLKRNDVLYLDTIQQVAEDLDALILIFRGGGTVELSTSQHPEIMYTFSIDYTSLTITLTEDEVFEYLEITREPYLTTIEDVYRI